MRNWVWRAVISVHLLAIVVAARADEKEELRGRLTARERDRQSVVAEADQVAGYLAEARAQYNAANQNVQNLELQLRSLRQQYTDCSREIEAGVKAIENLVERRAELTKQRQLLEDALDERAIYRSTRYRTSADAWAAHASFDATYNQLDHEAPQLQSRFESLQGTYLQLNLRLQSLEREKESAVEEMRRGEFCSGCGQTRSEILAKGEQFPHPGQHIVMATQEQVDEKATSYDIKINAIENQMTSLSQQINSTESQLNDVLARRQQAGTDSGVARSAAIQLEWLEKGREETKKQIAELKAKEDQLESQEQAKRDQDGALRRQAESLKDKIFQTEQDRNAQIAAANALANRIGELSSRMHALKRRQLQLDDEIADLRRRIEQT